jgi:Glycosyl hydrolases family 38 N-terminal domain
MPDAPDARRAVHIVPHTHWDREWYLPFQTFRLRLVGLIDGLLDAMARDPRIRFTLDGQLATVDDYLEVRPEREADVRRFIGQGRLAVGPWLILMDEFLVSGETIVRNLELGTRRAEALGGAMPVGYQPDMFGHIAQMPQILRRAGIGHAVVWRGVPSAIDRHAFRWTSPDGSTVRTEYLLGGYGNARDVFTADDPAGVTRKIGLYVASVAEAFAGDPVLAMYGEDHSLPRDDYGDLVDAVNAADGPYRLIVGTLTDYVAATGADETATAGLPEWRGELRSSARANVLMGVVGHRLDVRAAAGRAERILERVAEPLIALHGAGPWPGRLLELAWRRVVEDSAHDSICACSIDPVVDQVVIRFAEAEQIGRGLAGNLLADLGHRAPRGGALVLNPSPNDGIDLVEIEAIVPEASDVPALELPDGRRVPTQEVGRNGTLIADVEMAAAEVPGFIATRAHARELFQLKLNGYRIEDGPDGRAVVTLFVDEVADPPELDHDALKEAIFAAARAAGAARWRLRVEAAPRRRLLAQVPVPALGWTSVRVVAADADGPDRDPVSTGPRRLSNGLVAVEVADDGTLTIEANGRRISGAGRLVDGGDAGDFYNYAPPGTDRIVDRPTRVDVAPPAGGPLVARLDVRRAYDWPAGLDDDLAHPERSRRSEATTPVVVTTSTEVRAGEPFVRLAVTFDNPAVDHRLRFHVPLAARDADRSYAEGQFAVVERGLTMEAGHGEVALPTFPAHGWLAAGGAAVLLDHVLEYELVGGSGRRELALTLLRATGRLSRNLHPWRAEPAGPILEARGGQRLGPNRIAFAIMPFGGSWEEGGVPDAAEAYRNPFVVGPGGGAPDMPLTSGAGLRIDGRGVRLSALRRRDDWLELRLFAATDRPTRATVHGPFRAGREADLLGRPGRTLAVEPPGELRLELGPWEVRTVQLDPRD